MGLIFRLKIGFSLARNLGFLVMILLLNINSGITKDLTDDYLKSKPNGNSLDKKRWEKLKNDYKYKSPKPDTTEQEERKSGSPVSFTGGSGFLQVLAYISIFLLLAGVIYLLARYGYLGDKKLQKKTIDYDVNAEPEDINALKIDPLLADALNKGNYRLATRLQFLALLQLLNQKNLIQWKRDRTNSFYKQQLWGHKIHLIFKQLCLTYETVWYGDYEIDKDAYQSVNEKFNRAFSSINAKEYV